MNVPIEPLQPSASSDRRVRVLIVGAGFAGASTGYHLRALGESSVAVLERESDGAAHSSGRNAAMIRRSVGDPVVEALTRRGADALATGDLVPFQARGGFLIGAEQRGDDLADHVPTLSGLGAFDARDGTVSPTDLLARYLEDQRVEYGCELMEMHASQDGVRVTTTRGEWHTDIVVNAAGAWAGRVGEIDVTPTNRHVYRVDLPPAMPADAPYVWDIENGYYLRPEGKTMLTSPCDETPAHAGSYVERKEALDELRAKLDRLQPRLGDLTVRQTWVGQRTFSQDRRPIIGWDKTRPWLYHVAALGGHGVTLSFAVGEKAAVELRQSTRNA